ncbi:MAG: hypothetical protein HW384_560 [Dehalococcoidia bacterium]|nr:hypothetical protein [Dehalococcoidia bacterium]
MKDGLRQNEALKEKDKIKNEVEIIFDLSLG